MSRRANGVPTPAEVFPRAVSGTADTGSTLDDLDGMQARMRELRRQVDRARRPTVAVGATVGFASAVAAEVSRALAERDLAQARADALAEREHREALATGGPCRHCGLTRSWERDESGVPQGRWYGNGTICAHCEREQTSFTISDRTTDHEFRAKTLQRILPHDVVKFWAPDALPGKTGFRWWSETPNAPTSMVARFLYIDEDALTEPLIDKPIQHQTGDPCPRCGCAVLWFAGQHVQENGVLTDTMTCHGCSGAGDLVKVASYLIGIGVPYVESLGPAMSEVLEFYWWADDPAGGAANPPVPSASPFGYVTPNLPAIRRKALRLFPDPWQWRHRIAYEQAGGV